MALARLLCTLLFLFQGPLSSHASRDDGQVAAVGILARGAAAKTSPRLVVVAATKAARRHNNEHALVLVGDCESCETLQPCPPTACARMKATCRATKCPEEPETQQSSEDLATAIVAPTANALSHGCTVAMVEEMLAKRIRLADCRTKAGEDGEKVAACGGRQAWNGNCVDVYAKYATTMRAKWKGLKHATLRRLQDPAWRMQMGKVLVGATLVAASFVFTGGTAAVALTAGGIAWSLANAFYDAYKAEGSLCKKGFIFLRETVVNGASMFLGIPFPGVNSSLAVDFAGLSGDAATGIAQMLGAADFAEGLLDMASPKWSSFKFKCPVGGRSLNLEDQKGEAQMWPPGSCCTDCMPPQPCTASQPQEVTDTAFTEESMSTVEDGEDDLMRRTANA